MRRGGSISSSSRTCSACATLISTASVGLAAPDSRFAQVARGMPATPRDLLLGQAARLAQRLDVAAEVRAVAIPCRPGIANNMAACQCIGKPVDIIVRAGVFCSRPKTKETQP